VIYNNAKFDGTSLGGGSGINMDGVQNSRIENNLLYNNHASGISLYSIDAAAGASGNVIVNNTVRQPSDGRWAINIQDASTGNTALNNILISDHASRGAVDISADSLSGFVSDYNVVISRFNRGAGTISLAQWQTQTGNDAHSLVATAAALFADPSAGNYHLLVTSPAVDHGTQLQAPAVDFEGQPRPGGTSIDIGADELASAILAGDYNRDGAVNAADYVVWRKTDGAQAGYNPWRANFGRTVNLGATAGSTSASSVEPSSSTSIPEPACILMMLTASLAGLYRRWTSYSSNSCLSSI
jgi:parallel beta-helix repeat protein